MSLDSVDDPVPLLLANHGSRALELAVGPIAQPALGGSCLDPDPCDDDHQEAEAAGSRNTLGGSADEDQQAEPQEEPLCRHQSGDEVPLLGRRHSGLDGPYRLVSSADERSM